MLLHIYRTNRFGSLPGKGKCKTNLSYNNIKYNNQQMISSFQPDKIIDSPSYGLITFGNIANPFSCFLLPEPGMNGILTLPKKLEEISLNVIEPMANQEELQRKTSVLKSKFLEDIKNTTNQ